MKTLIAFASLLLSGCAGVILDPSGLDQTGVSFDTVSAKYRGVQTSTRHIEPPSAPEGGIDLVAYTQQLARWKDGKHRVLVVASGNYQGEVLHVGLDDAAVDVFAEFADSAHKRGALSFAQTETAKLDNFIELMGLRGNPYFAELDAFQRVQIGRVERKQIDRDEYGYLVAQKRRELAASLERAHARTDAEQAALERARRALQPRVAASVPKFGQLAAK
jgi:hypothetical protein